MALEYRAQHYCGTSCLQRLARITGVELLALVYASTMPDVRDESSQQQEATFYLFYE